MFHDIENVSYDCMVSYFIDLIVYHNVVVDVVALHAHILSTFKSTNAYLYAYML